MSVRERHQEQVCRRYRVCLVWLNGTEMVQQVKASNHLAAIWVAALRAVEHGFPCPEYAPIEVTIDAENSKEES